MNFEKLTRDEVTAVLKLLPPIVLHQLARENIVLAGGAIRDTVAGLPVKDLDIFCQSAEQAERLALEAAPFVRRTLFAFSVELPISETSLQTIPVQYVFYKEFTDAIDLIGQFDFRACCAGVWWAGLGHWFGRAIEGFHADCADKTLRFMSQQKDAGKLTALARALSLAKKGWTLSTNEAVSILTHYDPIFTPERTKYAFRPGYGGSR